MVDLWCQSGGRWPRPGPAPSSLSPPRPALSWISGSGPTAWPG